ncbi:hypothetical protein L6452_06485 [Arctium lappa]|uniref:Uncharacterized protein n=1 Tax=Arctium lappa TaxID=4217 RepID=A0ACB9EJB2_ARCLA|nr:hypothetical protein L6452_06485 [Arctium lappa]
MKEDGGGPTCSKGEEGVWESERQTWEVELETHLQEKWATSDLEAKQIMRAYELADETNVPLDVLHLGRMFHARVG